MDEKLLDKDLITSALDNKLNENNIKSKNNDLIYNNDKITVDISRNFIDKKILLKLFELLKGYNEFFHFPVAELSLIESLRTLRMMNYSAWLARRWGDPAFPRNFPWFNSNLRLYHHGAYRCNVAGSTSLRIDIIT